MIESILVPLDGSEAAETVLRYVRPIATAARARVSLLAVVREPEQWRENMVPDLKGECDRAGRYLESLVGRLRPDLPALVETEATTGEPASVIIERVARNGADLVAMTTHGRSGVARWVLGSIAGKVLHAIESPLLLVRPAPGGF